MVSAERADRVRKLVRAAWGLRLDVALFAAGLAALRAMARPEAFADLVAQAAFDREIAFQLALAVALGLFAVLSLRFAVRLFRAAQRVSFDPALRAEQGTVMAEFALVLPIVLLMLGTVFQIALIANAALVLRYAAFAAARSAIVSFEADMPGAGSVTNPSSLLDSLQVPPLPEFVDRTRPEHAASLVLASISPPMPSDPSPVANALHALVQANGSAWEGSDLARRVSYARQAMSLRTIRDKHTAGTSGLGSIGGLGGAFIDSQSPLIPLPEHAVQPQRLRDATPAERENLGYLAPAPPPVSELIPDSFDIVIEVPLPGEASAILQATGTEPPTITVPIDISPVKSMLSPLTDQVDAGTEFLRQGSASAIRAFARSPANVDFIAPKEVEIALTYEFKLTMPSILQLTPDFLGLTVPSRDGNGHAFLLQQRDTQSRPGDFTVRLQSTGGRRNLFGVAPVVPDVKGTIDSAIGSATGGSFEFGSVPNTPLYWRPRAQAGDAGSGGGSGSGSGSGGGS